MTISQSINLSRVKKRQEHQVTGEAAQDNLQFECCSIKINISIYFECSLLFFCFKVNWIPEIWSKPLIRARYRRKAQNQINYAK